MFTNDADHDDHNVTTLGENGTKTIQCLDEIIEFGLASLQKLESNLDNARTVNNDIRTMKEKFTENLRARIERIVKDLRIALDDHAMLLMGDVDKKVSETEHQAQDIIKKSTLKLDTAKQFIQKAATVLPTDDGNFDERQVTDLYNFYKALEKVNQQKEGNVKMVDVKIKYPNSMKTKIECAQLAQRIIGEIDNTKRPSLLNSQRPSIDMVNLRDFEASSAH